MKVITYTIQEPLGLHARPAGQMVNALQKFDCKVELKLKNKITNAKSILGVMSLAAKQGDTIEMTFSGQDEDEASSMIEKFLRDNF